MRSFARRGGSSKRVSWHGGMFAPPARSRCWQHGGVALSYAFMRTFRPTMIEVGSDGQPVVRAPVGFGGRVSEAQLEAWLVEHPDLAGEPLLILGSQLAEFAEDKDRLDVLAVDETGELVLLELKVDESFALRICRPWRMRARTRQSPELISRPFFTSISRSTGLRGRLRHQRGSRSLISSVSTSLTNGNRADESGSSYSLPAFRSAYSRR
jgi:hypothetical protein